MFTCVNLYSPPFPSIAPPPRTQCCLPQANAATPTSPAAEPALKHIFTSDHEQGEHPTLPTMAELVGPDWDKTGSDGAPIHKREWRWASAVYPGGVTLVSPGGPIAPLTPYLLH